MHSFEQHMYQRFADEIQSWDVAVATDIYAISFFIYDWEDDARRPQVHLGYNTIREWQSKIARASGSAEAKWNFAFWPQDFKVVIPDIPFEDVEDPASSLEEASRDDWLQALGLYFRDEDEPEGDAAFEEAIERWNWVTATFVALCVRVARRLHDTGVIAAKFGKPIPIIVHELEYYDTIATQTKKANPPGVAHEFEEWVAGMYEGSSLG
jgi:hypothetical protein